MAQIHGTIDPRFQAVADRLSESIDSGADTGASVCVMVDGEVKVDVWGGAAADGSPWQQDTLVNVFSTTKTMTFLVALMLADRGELDFEASVASYWPEFGKPEIKVKHVLSHSAGLAGWTEALEPIDLADWEKCTQLLAEQDPWWEPGTACGYHAVTQGYLIGELVRRITGKTFGTFLKDEVAGPLQADFHCGLPESEDARVMPLIPPPPVDPKDAGIPEMGVRALTNPMVTAAVSHEAWWRRAEIPAANGQGNARSVAKIQHHVALGGGQLLSAAGVERIFEVQQEGDDLVLGVPLRYGMGYGLSSQTLPLPPRACFWGGYGGSLVISDLDARMTVTYVMNQMASGLVGDVRGGGMAMAAYAAALGG